MIASALALAVIPNPVRAQLKSESAVYDIYQKYAAGPISEDSWLKASESLGDKSYTVQKGDTLWEISKVFFADPYFWTKIWALNSDIIFNPHSILPGDLLIFDLGSVERPPSMRIVRDEVSQLATEAESSGDLSDSGGVESPTSTSTSDLTEGELDTSSAQSLNLDDAGSSADVDQSASSLKELPSPIEDFMARTRPVFETVQLPPPSELPELPPETIRRVKEPLPESFVSWSGRPDPESLVKIQITPAERVQNVSTQYLKCWVDKEMLSPAGTIEDIEGDMHAAHENQFVHVKSDVVQVGRTYSVVKKVESFIERDTYIYEKEGDIQILERSALNPLTYRARVIRALNPILVNSEIVSYVPSEIAISPESELSSAPAKVVSGFCHEGRRLFGDGEIVFLKSEDLSLRIGQHLPIYRNEMVRSPKTKVRIKPRLIGSVQVLKVSGEWATASVVKAVEEIMTGDGTTDQIQTEIE